MPALSDFLKYGILVSKKLACGSNRLGQYPVTGYTDALIQNRSLPGPSEVKSGYSKASRRYYSARSLGNTFTLPSQKSFKKLIRRKTNYKGSLSFTRLSWPQVVILVISVYPEHLATDGGTQFGEEPHWGRCV